MELHMYKSNTLEKILTKKIKFYKKLNVDDKEELWNILTQLHHQNPKKASKRANLSEFQFTNPYKQGFLVSYI